MDDRREEKRQYRIHNAAKIKAYQLANQNTRIRKNREYRARVDPDGKRERDARYKRDYGISLAERQALLAAQSYRCACCGCDLGDGSKAEIEHCHSSRIVRGITCKACNVTLGRLGDTAESVAQIADVLIRYLTAGAELTKRRLAKIRSSTCAPA